MKRKLLIDGIFLVAIFAICVYVLGDNPVDLAKEIVVFYTILFALGVGVTIYIGYWLTRAMNPKLPPKEEENG